jgi:hypothetical protein
MTDDLVVEILDNDWVVKGRTNNVHRARKTEELGQVGNAEVEVAIDDYIKDWLPDPDRTDPYEGRFKIWETDGGATSLEFAGVIDKNTKQISDDGATISFGGKQRGIELSFVNTGRMDYLGWSLPQLFAELLRNNVAKEAVLNSVSSEDELYGAYQMVTGDPFKQNYWKTTSATPPHTATFHLGATRTLTAIRVMPQWWKDIDTLRFHKHDFYVEISTDGSSWTTVGTKSDSLPSSSKGHLFTFADTPAKYVKLTVTGSSDGYARIAQLMAYTRVATKGDETDFNVPFVENDDSGNMELNGNTTRPVVAGAFQGDSVITHSYVTKLLTGGTPGSITQKFRGTQSAVFFTSAEDGAGTANIYVDGVSRGTVSIPANRYWYKGYDTADDLGPLADEEHELKVEWASGSVQVDYFNGIYGTSWRPIEADDSSLAYLGSWSEVEATYFYNYFAAQSEQIGNELYYEFTGDKIKVKGSKGPGFGTFTWYLDGISQGTVDCSETTQFNKQNLINWSGTYGNHNIRLVHTGAGKIIVDRIEGNFTHTLYMRARYEPNLKVLIRLSEILESWVRFNHDGTVDLLGNVGVYGGTEIREGENEGGAIVRATVENDYSETGSAVLAIVSVNGELPIKALVIDKEAVAEIGYKLVKLEQADAADQFLLNRQALQYLRERRKPTRAYDMSFDSDDVSGDLVVGETTRLYAPTVGLNGTVRHRIGSITTEYVRD